MLVVIVKPATGALGKGWAVAAIASDSATRLAIARKPAILGCWLILRKGPRYLRDMPRLYGRA